MRQIDLSESVNVIGMRSDGYILMTLHCILEHGYVDEHCLLAVVENAQNLSQNLNNLKLLKSAVSSSQSMVTFPHIHRGHCVLLSQSHIAKTKKYHTF